MFGILDEEGCPEIGDMMDSCLTKLATHFHHDFYKVSQSFRKYLEFIRTLYPSQLRNVEADFFTTDICKGRFDHVQYSKIKKLKPNPFPLLGVGVKSPHHPETQLPPGNNLQIESQSTEIKPSGFSIFKDSLKKQFEDIYDKVRDSLPSIDDEEIEDDDEDPTEEKEIEIFNSRLPEMSSFEKKYFSNDEEFWRKHIISPRETVHFTKQSTSKKIQETIAPIEKEEDIKRLEKEIEKEFLNVTSTFAYSTKFFEPLCSKLNVDDVLHGIDLEKLLKKFDDGGAQKESNNAVNGKTCPSDQISDPTYQSDDSDDIEIQSKQDHREKGIGTEEKENRDRGPFMSVGRIRRPIVYEHSDSDVED